MRTRYLVLATALALALSIAVPVYQSRAARNRLDATRPVNGDVVVLAYRATFPNTEQVLSLANHTEHVARAGVFAISSVEISSRGRTGRGLVKLELADAELSHQLRLSLAQLPTPSSGEPEVTLGNVLAQHLGAARGDEVVLRPDNSEPPGTTVSCRVRAVVDFGFAHFNEQLAIVDLRSMSAFGLSPTGVELLLDQPDLRQTTASRLQDKLGPIYRVLSLEELVADSTPK
ncbi:MAG: hypothetical protein ABUL62_22145 [Myxococcales bacterium]